MPAYDFLVVGSGLFGATFARRAADVGKTVLVIDKRPHIAGNCFTDDIRGIQVHMYGPHIFHTASDKVWDFVTRFSEFNNYRHTAQVFSGGQHYSFPINLKTFRQLWGVQDAQEAQERLQLARIPCEAPSSLKDWVLSEIGEELYELFYRGYTRKQWGRDPSQLPASIGRRIPVRLTDDDHYYSDLTKHEGIPTQGYTQLVSNMLDDPKIHVELLVDFLDENKWRKMAKRILFTGPIDAYFDYQYGRLEYRSLRFEHELHSGWVQGCAQVNYPGDEPYTRTTEHKHFAHTNSQFSVVSTEFPVERSRDNEPYYPVRNEINLYVLGCYQSIAKYTNILFGGRLASFLYYDMDQTVASALALADQEL